MDFKYIIIAAGLGILGFLFYPRSEEVVSLSDFHFIKPDNIIKDEAPHYTGIYRSNPIVKTFDLGYVYRFNQAIVPFKNPVKRGPKRYTILVSHFREKEYSRAYDYVAESSEYPIPLQRFSNPAEGRWVQIIVDDWFRHRPDLKANEFKIGIQYGNPTPFRSISSEYNKKDLDKLVDLIISEDSKWSAAERITEEIEEEGKKKTKTSFSSPKDDIIVTFDLRDIIPIHGTRLTTDGPGNNLKRYEISVSIDGSKYRTVYVSPELEDKTVADFFTPSQKFNTRYVRLKINEGDWYGDYPEIREFELLTANHKFSKDEPRNITKYNALQVYYDDCGYDNKRSPNLVQGFSFDRGTGDENRHFYPEDGLESGNTKRQRSFCYHYDTIIFQYTNLSPKSLYWVQVTYLQPKSGNRIQTLDVDGYILHGSEVEIPKGKAKSYIFSIPKAAYADGEFELHFHRLAGINAVVSEVGIFEANPQIKQVAQRTLSRAVKVSTPVKIDGSLEEWPALYPLVPSNSPTSDLKSTNGQGCPLYIYLQWDKKNLYLGAEINRAAVISINGESLGKGKITDLLGRLNVFVDTTTSRSPGIYKTTDHHLSFYRIGSRKYRNYAKVAQIHHHLDAIPANISNRKEVEYGQDFTKTGYTLEARIPGGKVLQQFEPEVGKTIGFNYILSNRLTDNIGWAIEKIDAPPSQWGTVEFVTEISGKIVVMDEKSEKQISSFDAEDSVILNVWDTDRNANRSKAETINVELSGNITKDREKLTLTESDPMNYKKALSSDLFAFKLPTIYSQKPVQGDKVLQVVGNEVITLTYTDPYYAFDQTEKEVSVDLKVNVGADGKIIIAKESGKPISQFRAGKTLMFEIRDSDLSEYAKMVNGQGGKEVKGQEGKGVKGQGGKEVNGQGGKGGGKGVKGQEVNGQESQKDNKSENEKTEREDTQPAPRITEIELKVKETDEVEKVSIVPATESQEKERQDIYVGSIKTEYAGEGKSTPLDGVLQIAGAQRLVATYIDELQETGQTDVPVTAEAKVEVGDTGVLSVDPGKGVMISQDDVRFNAGTELKLRLKDLDINKDSSKKDTVEITSKGNMLNDKSKIVLEETGKSSGEFVGTCKTKYSEVLAEVSATSATAPVDDLLEVKGKEKVIFRYTDALQGTGATNVSVEIVAKVNTGEDGTLTIVRPDLLTTVDKFNAGDQLYFRLQDADESDKIKLTIVGNQTNDKENVELYPVSSTKDRILGSTFVGSIKTEYSENPIDDGVIQVQGKEKVIAIYIDKLRSTGETGVSVSDSASVNTGHNGRLAVYKKGALGKQIDQFKAGETLVLEIEDLDLSRTSAIAERIEMKPVGDIVKDEIRVSMREVSGNAGVFRGEIRTEYGEKAILNDNIMQVQGLGVVTFRYEDALQKTGKTGVPISVQLSVETGEKGNLEIYDANGRTLIAGSDVGIGSFSAGDTLTIKLSDNDLNIDTTSKDSAKVTVLGDRLKDELPLRLLETGLNSGVFEGKLLTEYGNSYNLADEILQITDKERVSVKYLDQIVTTGETNVTIKAQVVVLSSNPGVLFITDENGKELGGFEAGRTIHFYVQDLLLSTVGATIKPSIKVSGDKTNDRVTVTLDKVLGEEGIFEGWISTRYGTTAIYDDTLDVQGDEKITATYQPDIPGVHSLTVQDTTYVKKGNLGKILIVKNDGTPVYNFNPGATLYFRLEDPDLNKNPFDVDYADIWVSASKEGIGNYVNLEEEGRNSGIFVGSLKTQRGRSLNQRNEKSEVSATSATTSENARVANEVSATSATVLGLVGGEIVKATYEDKLIDTGETDVEITDTCRANSIGWVTFAKEKVIIDGIPDKWPLETVLKTEQNEALAWVQWDRNNLYILAQIYDDEVVVADPTKWYEGGTDALQLHIDLDPDEAEKPSYLPTNEKDEFIFWICPKGGGFKGIRPYAGQYSPNYVPNYLPIETRVKYHLKEAEPYYIIEAAIPFSPALGGFDPEKTTRNDKLGFNFVIYRHDAPMVKWAKPAEGSESVPLSKLGTLYLER